MFIFKLKLLLAILKQNLINIQIHNFDFFLVLKLLRNHQSFLDVFKSRSKLSNLLVNFFLLLLRLVIQQTSLIGVINLLNNTKEINVCIKNTLMFLCSLANLFVL